MARTDVARRSPTARHDADGGYEDEDEDDDDSRIERPRRDDSDDELAPESIAHVHHAGTTQTATRAPSRATRTPRRTCSTLEARVLEAFHNDPCCAERAIDIGAIARGVIELTGWVHSDGEVQHAVTIARGVPDVLHVVNQLTVRQPARRGAPPIRVRAGRGRPHPRASASPPRAD